MGEGLSFREALQKRLQLMEPTQTKVQYVPIF